MKKILLGIGAFVIILFAGLLVIPSVIDWNTYKPEITKQVRDLTGRDLTIGGDIALTLLPKPMLTAEQVALGNVEQASSSDLVTLRSVEVRIALAPLLGGNIRIETVRLVEPRVYLEILPDGRATWAFDLPSSGTAAQNAAADAPSTGTQASGPAVVLDSFEIVDGTVQFRDAAAGVEETISDIDVQVAAASLQSGPYQIDGSLVAKGMRLGVDADIGDIVEGRTFPVNLKLGVGGDSAQFGLTGTVLGLDAVPRFRGDMAFESGNVGRLVTALTDGTTLPPALGQPLKIEGVLDASATSLAVEDLALNFGGAMGTGQISGSFEGTPRIAAEIQIDRIDADPWMTKLGQGDGVNTVLAAAPSDDAPNTGTVQPLPASDVDNAFTIPTGLDATVVLRIGAIGLRNDRISDAVIDVALANGEVTLNQASLRAPGGASAQLFGFLTVQDGKPAFDGEMTAEIADVPALMTWADVHIGALQPNKPERLSVKTAVTGLGETLAVKELDLKVDETTVRGAANVALRDRLGIGATINIDQLNVDNYLADTSTQTPPQTSPQPQTSTETSGQQTADTSQAQPPLQGVLQPLTTFDANISASVGRLTYAGVPINGIDADIGLANGELTIRSFNVANAASVSTSVKGVLSDLEGVPSARGLEVETSVGDPAGLAALAGVDLPIPAGNLGKIDSTVKVDGNLLTPQLSGVVNALAGSLSFNGNVSPLNASSMFDLGLRLRHAEPASLLRRLGVDYRPSGAIGSLDLETRLSGNPAQVRFADLVAAIGASKVTGSGNLELSGVRPKLSLTAASNALVLDPFMPAQQATSLPPSRGAVIPARMGLVPEGVHPFVHFLSTASSRWSGAPIDLSALRTLDADVIFTAPSIQYQAYNMTDASVNAGLAAGKLRVNEFAGNIFDGAFQSKASVDASSPHPAIAAVLTLGDMNVGRAADAVGVSGASGSLTTRVDISTTGNSVADWVRALNGQGAFQVKGVRSQGSLSDVPIIGVTFAPLLQIFELLNTGLGSLIGRGGQTGLGETDIESTFNIANGIVSTQDMKILSNIYNGDIAGDINLPAWQMDVGGKIAVDQGVVGALLANVARIPNEIPFTVSGDIDAPNVNLQGFGRSGSQSGGSGIPIPGLDKLEEKVPGVGGLIQGILGGGRSGSSSGGSNQSAPPSQEPPSQEPPAQQPPQQPANPAEQLLRGIFGN